MSPTKKPTAPPTSITLTPIPTSQTTQTTTKNPTFSHFEAFWSTLTFDNFEDGNFPNSLWSTGGHGVWVLNDTKSIDGRYSIKNPNLSNLDSDTLESAKSNLTMVTCTDFPSGTLLADILVGFTSLLVDLFYISVDGRQIMGIDDGFDDFSRISLSIDLGLHYIDFMYSLSFTYIKASEFLPYRFVPVEVGSMW